MADNIYKHKIGGKVSPEVPHTENPNEVVNLGQVQNLLEQWSRKYNMTRLTYILLFIPFLGLGQQSNAPEIVFPMVEQFIAEAHAKDVRVYHKIPIL